MKKSDSYRASVEKLVKDMATFYSSTNAVCMLQIFLVMMFGIYYVYRGEITPGTFILFNTYTNMLVWPIRELGRILNDLGRMQVSMSRVYEILDIPDEEYTVCAMEHDLKGEYSIPKCKL